MPKSVVIADDHAVTVAGMRAAIEAMPDVDVVGTAKNGIEAIALVKKFRPDAALIDFSMPGANGLEVFVEARRWSPQTRFAVITGIEAPNRFRDLIDAGISGIFLKNMPPADICAGVRRVLAGETVVSADAEATIGEIRQCESLTAREFEVLQAIARGHSNGQIAERLCVSPKTVDSHRTSLMRKMGVHSTATLLVTAMRNGLIDV